MAPFNPLLAFLLLLAISISISPALAEIKEYTFKLTNGFWSADCVKKQVVLVNGAYPGPTIEVNEGDTIKVHVINELVTEGVSIHWHGIRQFKTVYMDGAAYVSECPIPSLSSFTYQFLASQAGTFMYHAHHGLLSAAGLYGKIIVHEPVGEFPYSYDGEMSLILNDWYHRLINEMSAGLSSIPFGWIGDPQSIVLNGKGKYNCSLIPTLGPNVPGGAASGDVKICDATSAQCARELFTVEPGKTYRFRIMSVATLNLFNIKIEGHSLTVVKADQYLVEKFTVDSIDIYSGQNVDFLFTATTVPGNYWISVDIRGRNNLLTPNGLAILNVGGVNVSDPTTEIPVHPLWNDTAFSTSQVLAYKKLSLSKGGDAPDVPKTSSRRLILVNTQQRYEGRIVWSMNNISHVLPATPVFHAIKSRKRGLYDRTPPPDVPSLVYDYTQPPIYTESLSSNRVYFFKRNQVVDIVLQNANTLTVNNSEYHPWHIHGHHFWVLGFGNGTFTSSDASKFNLVNPHYVNTVPIIPYGWTAVRWKADNPGAWFFHCHVIAHHYMGMSVVFAVGRKDGKDMPKLPKKTRKCGDLY